MRAKSAKLPIKKPLLLSVTEQVLLLVVLGLMVLRATYIENPQIEQIQTQFYLSSEIVSLFMSTILLGCFGLWLFVSIVTNHFYRRPTSLGVAAALFAAAGIAACLAASDKRAAVTNLVLLMTPVLSAVLLIQLLNAAYKTHLAVLLVLAVAAAMTVQCIDQYTESNEAVVQQYEQNPVEQLQKLGIEPDSLEHWLFEHRLYSNDIRGFLTTSNSAASFFLLSGFAALGLCIEAFRRRNHPETVAAFAGYLLALLLIVGGLLMTQSKGGIGAFVIGLFLLVVLSVFGRRLWKHRLVIGILLLVGIAAAGAAVISYGSTHGRLPGGNSMLVRWQYWQSTAEMTGDHLLTGVGGGNFRFFYPLYKPAAASETIQDPHNFILSLLSQYGPLGLAAFLAAVLWPIYKNLRQRFASTGAAETISQPFNKVLWLGLLGISACLFLFIRPMLIDTSFWYQRPDERAAAYVVLYLFPAGIFALAFGLLGAAASGDESVRRGRPYLSLALICGITAVLIHNLVDFALFETGVWNIFWLVMAVLIAASLNDSPSEGEPIRFSVPVRLLLIFALAAVAAGYLAAAVIPPVKANRLFRQAMMSRTPQFELIEEAIAADGLSPDTAYNAAGILKQAYQQRPVANSLELLRKAYHYAQIAQQRNPVSFKPPRLRADIALLLADSAESDAQTTDYLQAAYDALLEASKRYPGSGRIHYNLGRIADRLDRPQEALVHYQKAVAVEQAYREQFKLMYPGRRPVISRLGNTAYTIAQARIEELRKKINE